MSKADQRQENVKAKDTGEETGAKIREEGLVTKPAVVRYKGEVIESCMCLEDEEFPNGLDVGV